MDATVSRCVVVALLSALRAASRGGTAKYVHTRQVFAMHVQVRGIVPIRAFNTSMPNGGGTVLLCDVRNRGESS